MVVSAIENGAGSVARVGAADLAEHRLHARQGGDVAILLRQLAVRVLGAEPGRRRRHVQKLTLVDVWQELAAEVRDDRQAGDRGQRRRHQRDRGAGQHEVHERPVSAHERGGQRVAQLRDDAAPEQPIAQRGRERQRDERPREHHQRLA